ncbi:MAG: preprotein translocase subunit SecG [Clostridia bacterium]|nr:preprotein translocase subunit SecG [Clostridia bacterium]
MGIGVLKYIVLAIYMIICIALIIVATIQTKDANGASEAIMGSSTSNFYEKNKGRTKEGKMKRLTIILGIAFVVVSIALGVIYVM